MNKRGDILIDFGTGAVVLLLKESLYINHYGYNQIIDTNHVLGKEIIDSWEKTKIKGVKI